MVLQFGRVSPYCGAESSETEGAVAARYVRDSRGCVSLDSADSRETQPQESATHPAVTAPLEMRRARHLLPPLDTSVEIGPMATVPHVFSATPLRPPLDTAGTVAMGPISSNKYNNVEPFEDTPEMKPAETVSGDFGEAIVL